MYRNVQDLLLNAVTSKDYTTQFKFMGDFYGSDLNSQLLQSQSNIFKTAFADKKNGQSVLSDIIEYFRGISPSQKELLSEVCTLLTLLLVMPATTAVSERSFSSLRRLKTYLRSTTTQNRLSHLVIL